MRPDRRASPTTVPLAQNRPISLDQVALQRLLDISAEILGQLDLDRLLASILTGAADLLTASQINLYRYLPEADHLETWIALRAPAGISQVVIRRGEGLAGAVLVSGRGMRLDNYDAWPARTPQWPTGVTGPSMAVPFRRPQELMGVITVSRPPGGPLFTDSDLALLQLFASQAAVAIANARLYAAATRRAEELSKLYDTSLDIAGDLDVQHVLHATLQRATDLLGSSANLRIHDPGRDLLVPLLPLHQPESFARAELRPGEGLSGRVFVSGEAEVVNDYDRWEGRSPQYPRGAIGRAMAVPLRTGGVVTGVLALNRPSDSAPFSDDDLRLLTLFANQASVAITNARQVAALKDLHTQQIAKERLDRQLEMAQAVQVGLLPDGLPTIPGWELASRWRPALELGGDYYDLIPLAPGLWGLLMADVSDKGVAAALLMAVARSLFRVYASAARSPAETLARVNVDLVESSHSGMFITAVYAVADMHSGEVHLAGAGHPPALVGRRPGPEAETIRTGGMPLGIQPEATFQNQTIHIAPGERIVLYTDGTTEASNSGGEQFGAARLEGILRQGEFASAADTLEAIDRAVRAFVGDTPASDDVAYLVLRRKP